MEARLPITDGMDIAQKYARAIHDARKGGVRGLAAKARAALALRGHAKLMPKIVRELERLALRETRREMHVRVTPEDERKRVLIDLYNKLIRS